MVQNDQIFIRMNIDLLYVKIGKKYIVTFPYKQELIESIDKLEVSCDCFDVIDNKKDKRIEATWVPKELPKHLKEKDINKYSTQKTITVTFRSKDEPNQKRLVFLLFNAIVKE